MKQKKRGAEVVLVSGPVKPMEIDGITRIEVRTNKQMKDTIAKYFDSSDALIMAAAPVDYRVENPSDKKIKKNW